MKAITGWFNVGLVNVLLDIVSILVVVATTVVSTVILPVAAVTIMPEVPFGTTAFDRDELVAPSQYVGVFGAAPKFVRAAGAVVAPVPPYVTPTAVPCQVPVVIVPTVVSDVLPG